jgi:hypothetical protein
MLFEHYPSHLN